MLFRSTKSLFICGVFSSLLNVSGILLGIFYWGNLNAVAWCIVVTFTINFIQCYLQMYLVTFKRNLFDLIKQFVSPLILSFILIAILWFVSNRLHNINIFPSLIIKTIITFIIFGTYIQWTGEYNIIQKIKQLFLKIKHK